MAAHDGYNSDDDDAPIDTNAFINTGADLDGLYMPSVNEEFHARDAKAGGSKSTKQRLVFTGFSEETP